MFNLFNLFKCLPSINITIINMYYQQLIILICLLARQILTIQNITSNEIAIPAPSNKIISNKWHFQAENSTIIFKASLKSQNQTHVVYLFTLVLYNSSEQYDLAQFINQPVIIFSQEKHHQNNGEQVGIARTMNITLAQPDKFIFKFPQGGYSVVIKLSNWEPQILTKWQLQFQLPFNLQNTQDKIFMATLLNIYIINILIRKYKFNVGDKQHPFQTAMQVIYIFSQFYIFFHEIDLKYSQYPSYLIHLLHVVWFYLFSLPFSLFIHYSYHRVTAQKQKIKRITITLFLMLPIIGMVWLKFQLPIILVYLAYDTFEIFYYGDRDFKISKSRKCFQALVIIIYPLLFRYLFVLRNYHIGKHEDMWIYSGIFLYQAILILIDFKQKNGPPLENGQQQLVERGDCLLHSSIKLQKNNGKESFICDQFIKEPTQDKKDNNLVNTCDHEFHKTSVQNQGGKACPKDNLDISDF